MSAAAAQEFQDLTKQILDRLGVMAVVTVTHPDHLGLRAQIDSADSALLIGPHGQTLAALEHLVRILLMHKLGSDEVMEFHLDVGDYRQRQQSELIESAQKAAEAVRQTGTPEILRPMNAFERRIVHVTLADMDDLATESIGAEPNRRIIIKPKI